MMDEFKINVVERATFKVVGMKVRTDMAAAMNDAMKLWESDFGPRMPEVAAFPNTSYGLSTMVDETHFDYMAALPWREGDPVPQGMELMEIAGGLYAECRLDSLKDLAMGYQYAYNIWPTTQATYEIAFAPCYEEYPADHMESGKLTLYLPVKKKG